MMPRGLFRERSGEGSPVNVFVQFEKDRFDVPEALYRHFGYEPPFDDLPWNGRSAPQTSPPRRPLFRS